MLWREEVVEGCRVAFLVVVSGTAKSRSDSLFGEGWGGPAARHVLLVLPLLFLRDLAHREVSLREFAALLPAVTFCVETGANVCAQELYTFVRALALEALLPRFIILHFEFGNLVGVDQFVVTLASSLVLFSITLALSLSRLLVGAVLFAWRGLRDRHFFVEVGRECHIEARQEDVHVEVLKVDKSFVNILAIVTAATLVQNHVHLFLDCKKNLCGEVFVDRNAILVVDAVPPHFFNKEDELDCQPAGFSEDVFARACVSF